MNANHTNSNTFVPTLIDAFNDINEYEFLLLQENLYKIRYPENHRLNYYRWLGWYKAEKFKFKLKQSIYNHVTIQPMTLRRFYEIANS